MSTHVKGTDALAPQKIVPQHNAAVHVIIGSLLLVVWVGGSLFQIQTTEAWFLKEVPPGAGDAWGMILQLGDLISGKLTGVQGEAIYFGWGVEVVTIALGVTFEAAKHGVLKSGQTMKNVFLVLSTALLIGNFITDFQYVPSPQGAWGQALFALVATIVVLFFLPISIEQFVRAKKSR